MFEQAFTLFEQAGNRGYARGWSHLIGLYSEEKGVKRDEREMARLVELVKRSSDEGDVVGHFALGWLFVNGHGVERDKKIAFELYLKAAEQGYANSQFNLGSMFDNGEGVAKDKMKAIEWYLRAADQGYADAQFNLGVMFANGEGVAKDATKSFEWYLKAADQGHADAQCNLGWMFANGNGVKQNFDETVKFYQLAILGGCEQAKLNLLSLGNRNISQAQCLLGELYLEGRGFVKDEKKAVEWIAKAAQQHDDGAIEKLHMMAEQGHAEAQDKLCEMNETK
jgi:uncharacterized protein